LRRGGATFRRQLQEAKEQNEDDAEDNLEGSDAAPEAEDSVDEKDKDEDSLVPSNIPVESEEGVLCLKHALTNILLAYAVGNRSATTEQFEEAAAALKRKYRSVLNIAADQFGNRDGYEIDVPEEYLRLRLPCCHVHSVSGEVGDGEEVIGCIVHEAARAHFVCMRPVGADGWQRDDSVGSQTSSVPRHEALAVGPSRYFLLHSRHDCDYLLSAPVDDADTVAMPSVEGDDEDVIPLKFLAQHHADRQARSNVSRGQATKGGQQWDRRPRWDSCPGCSTERSFGQS